MNRALQPWEFLLITLSGWVNRHQEKVIDYLIEENRVLKEKLGGKRIRFTDNERRRLAVKGKALGRRLLGRVASIVTADTILAWHRKLIAKKWDHSSNRGPGRPRVMNEIADLIVRMARENPGWGYTRIRGALANLEYKVSRTTISTILKENGIEPAPERGERTPWRTFLKAHWESLAAMDFFTVEVATLGRLVTYYVLIVVELSTRRVQVAGLTPNPDAAFMMQVGRSLTDVSGGFLAGKHYLIMDRDRKYSEGFRSLLEESGTNVLRLPPRSPNLNAFAERFVLSIKQECLERMIFFSEESLRRAVSTFVAHYHQERNHQGLNNRLIEPETDAGKRGARVCCRERLGGMLRYYYREAA